MKNKIQKNQDTFNQLKWILLFKLKEDKVQFMISNVLMKNNIC